MRFIDLLASVAAFRTIPTTILVVLVYAAILTTVLVTDQLPTVPRNQRGLNLTQAYTDLHQIASRPHPYNSHANDLVRSYILSRLRTVSARHTHVQISDDLTSNCSWAAPLTGVYFEGSNILVKIDGSDPEHADSGAVLFSAHYDSVSTASGAVDDGMGVATLMQLVGYFATNRPKRTAVFNINNGEEDGLNGAHAFLQHPWSNITDTFLNLEGASSGGRPILFRATSTAPLLSFLNTHVTHPHANVLAADAFARGVIRSSTDYSVYTGAGAGMQGLDLSFYKGRSKYHTKFDSIPHVVGREKALWAMMEAAQGSGLALLNDGRTHAESGGGGVAPVYFDLFGAALVMFSLTALLTFNIVFLVVGPVVAVLLVACEHILQEARRERRQNGVVPRNDPAHFFRKLRDWLREQGIWSWAKFWVALVLSAGLQVLLVLGYVKLNPFIIYSRPYLVVLSSLTLTYLSLSLVLTPSSIIPPSFLHFINQRILCPNSEDQKQTLLLQTYILTYILLLLSTIFGIGKAHMGGVYFFSVWNACAFLAWAGACMEGMVRGGSDGGNGRPEGGRRFVRGVRFEAANDQGQGEDGTETETEPTEITPLIHQHQQERRPSRSRSPSAIATKEEGGAIGWWVAQLLLAVPAPAILTAHIGVLLAGAMPQTLADGSSAVAVYSAMSLLSISFLLPLAPFTHKLHRSLTYLFALIFIVTTVYTWLAFPFSQEAPLKVFFQQKVHLSQQGRLPEPSSHAVNSNSTAVVTLLTGVPYYLERIIIPTLPSAAGKTVECVPAATKIGLVTCMWESGTAMVPSPGGDSGDGLQGGGGSGRAMTVRTNPWLTSEVVKVSGRNATAKIWMRGTNTRACRLYFYGGRVGRYAVRGSGDEGGMQEGYEVGEHGVDVVKLWSRTWDREFVVGVEWLGGEEKLKGSVACEWAEYESGMVGVGGAGERRGKIPAFEEVLGSLPKWAVVTKTNDGLVEVLDGFEI